jgi:hypothetical protein
MPVVHFVAFKIYWHPGQYTTEPSTDQLVRMLRCVGGALSLDFLGPGLALSVLAVAIHLLRRPADPAVATTEGTTTPLRTAWQRHRVTILAAVALLVAGIGIYLPLGGVAGRYSIPAVWGADLLLAVLLSELAAVPLPGWRRAAYVALGCGLAAVAVANLGKQDKFAARSALLWQVVERVERQAPHGACVAWIDGPQLNVEEGIHFRWHLRARGRSDLALALLDAHGQPIQRVEASQPDTAPDYVVTGTDDQPLPGSWHQVGTFHTNYLGLPRPGRYDCYLWQQSIVSNQEAHAAP